MPLPGSQLNCETNSQRNEDGIARFLVAHDIRQESSDDLSLIVLRPPNRLTALPWLAWGHFLCEARVITW